MWEHKESLEHLDLQCEMLEEYHPVCVLIYYEYDKYKNIPTYTIKFKDAWFVENFKLWWQNLWLRFKMQ